MLGSQRAQKYTSSVGAYQITELLGDGIGPELRVSLHRIAEVIPLDFEFRPIDLSLENRNARGRTLYDEVVSSMKETKLSVKYPTVTENESPNAVLRRRLDFAVIHRPVISIEGIDSNFKENVFLHIVRVATGGTYEDPGKMIGDDAAVSLRIVERKPCRYAALFAFELARKSQASMTSSSKHTIQKVTDGFFEKIVKEVGTQYPDVRHQVELFDALLAKIILNPQDYRVVLCLNEYGDFLSDMASGLVGSLGTGASASYSFTDDGHVDVAMFDPAGGTAPDIAGQNKCNPSASLLAFSMLLDHIDRSDLGRSLRRAIRAKIGEGRSTADLGGSLSTTEFTEAVAEELASRVGSST